MTPVSRPLRLLHYLIVIGFETTLIHLLGALLTHLMGQPALRWWVLFAVVGAGALATAWLERTTGEPGRIRGVTGALALGTIAAGTWAQLRSLTPAGLSVLFDLNRDESLLAYVVVLATIAAWWRGARLVDAEHGDVVRYLRNGVLMLVGMLLLLALAGDAPDLIPATQGIRLNIAAELIGYLALGLTSLSLARIVATGGESTPRAAWHRLRSGIMSTLVLVAVGVALLAVVADPAREVLRTALRWTLYGLLAALSPFFWLIFKLFEIIHSSLMANRSLEPLLQPTATTPPQEQLVEPSRLGSLALLINASTALLLLVPVAALVLLILFSTRHRRHAEEVDGEEHESIFSWSAAAGDLRDLFRALGRAPNRQEGLLSALARLAGPDPVMRIRRRYVQLLLAAEESGRARDPAQTPHEYAETLAQLPLDTASTGTLTELYTEARYAPDDVTVAAAARADAAWEALDASRSQHAKSMRRAADHRT